jgi:hypothetical protein
MSRIVSQTDAYLNNKFVHTLHFLIVLKYYVFHVAFWRAITNYPINFMSGCITGWLAADALSYIVHMFIDSSTYTKWITQGGKIPIRTIIDTHHEHPLNYSQLTRVELISITYPVVLSLQLYFIIYELFYQSAFMFGFKASIVFFGLLSGYIHKWTHERYCNIQVPCIVKKFQDYRIILHPQDHKIHHQTYDCQYSLVSGIVQPLFDAVAGIFLYLNKQQICGVVSQKQATNKRN